MREDPKGAGVIPGPRGGWRGDRHGSPLDTLRFHERMREQYGDVVELRRLGPLRYVLASAPDDVERVLRTNGRNYGKPALIRHTFGLLLGDGLFTSEGGEWLRQRRVMQPAFHRARIEAFAALMVEEATALAERWKARAGTGGAHFDVLPDLMTLSLRVVSRALFRSTPEEESAAIRHSFTEALGYIDYRMRNQVAPPLFLPTPRNLAFRRARGQLDRAVQSIVAGRRSSNRGGEDLLSMLLEARDAETGEGLDDRGLRDEVVTLLLAGHETTAVGLTWILYLVASHPEVQRTLLDEIARVLGVRTPTVDDFGRLEYAGRVVDEALRLYPPAWVIGRQAKAADTLGGYSIPAGRIVLIYPYLLHRDRRWWDDPEQFDPDRWAPERRDTGAKGAYLPFGGGARQCIGNGFALMELRLTLATLLQELRLAPTALPVLQPSVTLRPRYGLTLDVRRRDGSM